MAITDQQKIDFLFKKLGFGATKTDTAALKGAVNEEIPSPLLLSGTDLWTEAYDIPGTKPNSSSYPIEVYQDAAGGTATVQTAMLGTASTNRSWNTGLTDWIPPQFGSTYQVKVFVDNPAAANPESTGTQLFAAGSGNNDEWFFDYQSGILNFIGTNIPSGLGGKRIYIVGARYIGKKGNRFAVLYSDSLDAGHLMADSANITRSEIITAVIDSADVMHAIIDSADITLGKIVNAQITNLDGDSAHFRALSADSISTSKLNVDIVTANQLQGPANLIIDPAAVGDATGMVQILGNLQVEGTTTTINSTTVSLNDKNLILADSSINAAASDGAGITVKLGQAGPVATILYKAAGDNWEVNKDFHAPLLNADSADISLLRTDSASITHGTITNLFADSADIRHATIDSAKINALTHVDSADFINASFDYVNIDNADIDSAFIAKLDVSALKIPGTQANRFLVADASGVIGTSINFTGNNSQIAFYGSAMNIYTTGRVDIASQLNIGTNTTIDGNGISSVDGHFSRNVKVGTLPGAGYNLISKALDSIGFDLDNRFYSINSPSVDGNNVPLYGGLQDGLLIGYNPLMDSGHYFFNVQKATGRITNHGGFKLGRSNNVPIGQYTFNYPHAHTDQNVDEQGNVISGSYKSVTQHHIDVHHNRPFYGLELTADSGKLISTAIENVFLSPVTTGSPKAFEKKLLDVRGLHDSSIFEVRADGNLSFTGNLLKEGQPWAGGGLFEKDSYSGMATYYVDPTAYASRNTYGYGNVALNYPAGGFTSYKQPNHIWSTGQTSTVFNWPKYQLSVDGTFGVRGQIDSNSTDFVINPGAYFNHGDNLGQVQRLTNYADDSDGSKMYYIPSKAIFRAGLLRDSALQKTNMGMYSIGMGLDPIAKGFGSVAIGVFDNMDSGPDRGIQADYSIGIGRRNTDTNTFNKRSVFIGIENKADRKGGLGETPDAVAIGFANRMRGRFSRAFGDRNTVSGISTGAFGTLNIIGDSNTSTTGTTNGAGTYVVGNDNFVGPASAVQVIGNNNRVTNRGYGSQIFGINNRVDKQNSMVLGQNNIVNARNGIVIGQEGQIDSPSDFSMMINLDNQPQRIRNAQNLLSIRGGNVAIGDSVDHFTDPAYIDEGNLYVKGSIITEGTILQQVGGTTVSNSPFTDDAEFVFSNLAGQKRRFAFNKTTAYNTLEIDANNNKAGGFKIDAPLLTPVFRENGPTKYNIDPAYHSFGTDEEGNPTAIAGFTVDSFPFDSIPGSVKNSMMAYIAPQGVLRIGKYSSYADHLDARRVGFQSMSFGQDNVVGGLRSIAFGKDNNLQRGRDSLNPASLVASDLFVVGTNNLFDSIATGNNITVFGDNNRILGDRTGSVIIGDYAVGPTHVTPSYTREIILRNVTEHKDSSLNNTRVAIGKPHVMGNYALDIRGDIRLDSGSQIYIGGGTIGTGRIGEGTISDKAPQTLRQFLGFSPIETETVTETIEDPDNPGQFIEVTVNRTGVVELPRHEVTNTLAAGIASIQTDGSGRFVITTTSPHGLSTSGSNPDTNAFILRGITGAPNGITGAINDKPLFFNTSAPGAGDKFIQSTGSTLIPLQDSHRGLPIKSGQAYTDDRGINQTLTLVGTGPVGVATHVLSTGQITGGSGDGNFSATVKNTGGTYSIHSINTGGTNYVIGDQLTVPGQHLGGATPTNDATITVTGLNSQAQPGVNAADITGTGVNAVLTGASIDRIYYKRKALLPENFFIGGDIEVTGKFLDLKADSEGLRFTAGGGTLATPTSQSYEFNSSGIKIGNVTLQQFLQNNNFAKLDDITNTVDNAYIAARTQTLSQNFVNGTNVLYYNPGVQKSVGIGVDEGNTSFANAQDYAKYALVIKNKSNSGAIEIKTTGNTLNPTSASPITVDGAAWPTPAYVKNIIDNTYVNGLVQVNNQTIQNVIDANYISSIVDTNYIQARVSLDDQWKRNDAGTVLYWGNTPSTAADRVGIGTETPASRFEVVGKSTLDSVDMGGPLRIEGTLLSTQETLDFKLTEDKLFDPDFNIQHGTKIINGTGGIGTQGSIQNAIAASPDSYFTIDLGIDPDQRFFKVYQITQNGTQLDMIGPVYQDGGPPTPNPSTKTNVFKSTDRYFQSTGTDSNYNYLPLSAKFGPGPASRAHNSQLTGGHLYDYYDWRYDSADPQRIIFNKTGFESDGVGNITTQQLHLRDRRLNATISFGVSSTEDPIVELNDLGGNPLIYNTTHSILQRRDSENNIELDADYTVSKDSQRGFSFAPANNFRLNDIFRIVDRELEQISALDVIGPTTFSKGPVGPGNRSGLVTFSDSAKFDGGSVVVSSNVQKVQISSGITEFLADSVTTSTATIFKSSGIMRFDSDPAATVKEPGGENAIEANTGLQITNVNHPLAPQNRFQMFRELTRINALGASEVYDRKLMSFDSNVMVVVDSNLVQSRFSLDDQWKAGTIEFGGGNVKTLSYQGAGAVIIGGNKTSIQYSGFTDSDTKFQVNEGNVIFKQASGDGDVEGSQKTFGEIPPIGAGSRFMWIPQRGALRAGEVSDTRWDDLYVGSNSVALGYNARAWDQSIAIGRGAEAGGVSYSNTVDLNNPVIQHQKAKSIAIGDNVVNKGKESIAIGVNIAHNTSLSSSHAANKNISLGIDITNNSRTQAIGIGQLVSVSNIYDLAIGYDVSTTGSGYDGAVAIGVRGTQSTRGSVAIGYNATSSNYHGVSIGRNTSSQVSNVAIGLEANAVQSGAAAIGVSVSTGNYGVSIGSNQTTGTHGVSIGKFNDTSNEAVSIGSTNSATVGGVAIGRNTRAERDSVAIGKNIRTSSYSSVSIGMNNTGGDHGSVIIGVNNSDIYRGAFIVGKGNYGINAHRNNNRGMVIGVENHTIGGYGFTTARGTGDFFVVGRNNYDIRSGNYFGEQNNRLNQVYVYGNKVNNIENGNFGYIFGEGGNIIPNQFLDDNTRPSFQFGKNNEIRDGGFVFGQANIGRLNAYAFGSGNLAVLGGYAFGYDNTVYGDSSVGGTTEFPLSFGRDNTVTGGGIAYGENNTVSNRGQAIGGNNTSSGTRSIAIGSGINVSGTNSVGIGLNNTFSGNLVSSNTFAVMGGRVGINTATPSTSYIMDIAGHVNVQAPFEYYRNGQTFQDYLKTDHINNDYILNIADSDYVQSVLKGPYTAGNYTYATLKTLMLPEHGFSINANTNNLRYTGGTGGVSRVGIGKEPGNLVGYSPPALDVSGNMHLTGGEIFIDNVKVIPSIGNVDSFSAVYQPANYNIAADSAELVFNDSWIFSRLAKLPGQGGIDAPLVAATGAKAFGFGVNDSIGNMIDQSWVTARVDPSIYVDPTELTTAIVNNNDAEVPFRYDATNGKVQFTTTELLASGKPNFNGVKVGINTVADNTVSLKVTGNGTEAVEINNGVLKLTGTNAGIMIEKNGVLQDYEPNIQFKEDATTGNVRYDGGKDVAINLGQGVAAGAALDVGGKINAAVGLEIGGQDLLTGIISGAFLKQKLDTTGRNGAAVYLDSTYAQALIDSAYIKFRADSDYILTAADSDYVKTAANLIWIRSQADSDYIHTAADSNYIKSAPGTPFEFTGAGINQAYIRLHADSNYIRFHADSDYVKTTATREYIRSHADSDYILTAADSDYVKTVATREYILGIADSDYILTAADSDYIKLVADSDYIHTAVDSAHIDPITGIGTRDIDFNEKKIFFKNTAANTAGFPTATPNTGNLFVSLADNKPYISADGQWNKVTLVDDVPSIVDSAYVSARMDSDMILSVTAQQIANAISAGKGGKTVLRAHHYNAVAGQTEFENSDRDGTLLSYIINSMFVTVNGVTLTNVTDYSATTGTKVIFHRALDSGDEVGIYSTVFGGGGINIEDSAVVTSGAQTVIDQFAHLGAMRSAEYIVHMDDSSIGHSRVSKVLLTYNRSIVNFTEFGVLTTFGGDSDMGLLSADETGGIIRLKFNKAAGTGNVRIKTNKTII